MFVHAINTRNHCVLSESTGGICINGFSYYVFCHADDLLFTSLTETGFQKLINVANEYITSHGLRFNVLQLY